MRLIVRVLKPRRTGRPLWPDLHCERAQGPFYGSYVVSTHKVPVSENTIRRILREERPDVIEICDKYNLQIWAG